MGYIQVNGQSIPNTLQEADEAGWQAVNNLIKPLSGAPDYSKQTGELGDLCLAYIRSRDILARYRADDKQCLIFRVGPLAGI